MWARGGANDGRTRRVTSRRAVLIGGLGLAASHTAAWRWMSSAAVAEPAPGPCAPSGYGYAADVTRRLGMVLVDPRFAQVKDPSITFDGRTWHLFASAWRSLHDDVVIVHGSARQPQGPYVSPEVLDLPVTGPQVAAPGVLWSDGSFHMFVQTRFSGAGGMIEHLASSDGTNFEHVDRALDSDVAIGEGCLYDAQPAIAGDELLLTYAATNVPGQPDLHLARSRSGTWDGPWERLGPILRQSEVSFHNQPACGHYEWGLEGPQLVDLRDGRLLLAAVCFLADQPHGRRQRLFLALADGTRGPYRPLGEALVPVSGTWEAGENGHAAVTVVDNELVLVYQARRGAGRAWSVGAAVMPIPDGHGALDPQ